MMKHTTLLSLLAAGTLAFATGAHAAGSRTYQVTGPILEMNDTMVAVQKGSERWELARDASTRANGNMKVGDKVTVTYTMTATRIESKGAGKAGDAAPKAASTPSASAAKR